MMPAHIVVGTFILAASVLFQLKAPVPRAPGPG